MTTGSFCSSARYNIKNIIFTHYFNTIKNNFTIRSYFNTKHNYWGCRASDPRDTVFYNFYKNINKIFLYTLITETH